MRQIDIDGKLVRETLAEFQLGVIKLKIKELDNEIEKLKDLLNYSPDIDSAIRSIEFFR